MTQVASYSLQLDAGVDEEDPRLHMTPGGVLEDMFRGLSSKAPDPIAISEVWCLLTIYGRCPELIIHPVEQVL